MYITARNQKLPAGLVDKGVEFFVFKNEVYCLHDGRRIEFEELPEEIIKTIEDDIMNHPEALKSLSQWENLTQSDYVRQYIMCRFGSMDGEADIDVDGKINHTEYFDCGIRGTCKYEGKLCCSIKVENGHLTKTELEILRHINLPDKIIADKTCKAIDTVISHQQSIREKTGLKSKVELAIFAQKKGII